MLKRDTVQEEVHDLAYSVIWREFNQVYANAQCDYLSDQLAQKLMADIEQFVDDEHRRRERLAEERQREVEVQIYG